MKKFTIIQRYGNFPVEATRIEAQLSAPQSVSLYNGDELIGQFFSVDGWFEVPTQTAPTLTGSPFSQ